MSRSTLSAIGDPGFTLDGSSHWTPDVSRPCFSVETFAAVAVPLVVADRGGVDQLQHHRQLAAQFVGRVLAAGAQAAIEKQIVQHLHRRLPAAAGVVELADHEPRIVDVVGRVGLRRHERDQAVGIPDSLLDRRVEGTAADVDAVDDPQPHGLDGPTDGSLQPVQVGLVVRVGPVRYERNSCSMRGSRLQWYAHSYAASEVFEPTSARTFSMRREAAAKPDRSTLGLPLAWVPGAGRRTP
jgi:hypothetical protein